MSKRICFTVCRTMIFGVLSLAIAFVAMTATAGAGSGDTAPAKILLLGDTHGQKLAPHLAEAFGKDAEVYFNGERVNPGAKPSVRSASVRNVLSKAGAWLKAREYQAVYMVFGHENSAQGEQDVIELNKSFARLADQAKASAEVVVAADLISTRVTTEAEKRRNRNRDGLDNEHRKSIKKNGLVYQEISKRTRAHYRKIGHDGQYYKDEAYKQLATKSAMPLLRKHLVEANLWKFDFTRGVGGSDKDRVFYVGAKNGKVSFDTIRRLSNGKILLGGGASDLSWLPTSTQKTELAGAKPESGETGLIPFILLFDAEFKAIEHAVMLPKGSAYNITRIRDTGVPGMNTGDLYIAGERKGDKSQKIKTGFFIARLDGNFVDKIPSKMQWVVDVWSTQRDAWDVNSKGECVFIAGEPHGWNWYEMIAIGADGERIVVENWQHHWYEDSAGKRHLFKGKASDVPGKIWHSAFMFKKAYSKESTFRSWSKKDFMLKTSDGNGGTKMGKWPFDAMYPGHWNPTTEKSEIVLEGVWDTKKQKTVPATKDKKGKLRVRKHGYYGYKMSDLSCEINTIEFDRRDDTLYVGGCNKSHMGQPDFEPWVIAFDRTGKLKWWQRLYAESKGISTPDQYVDNIVVDYNRPKGYGGLVVTARAHGNNVNNFYMPHELVHPNSSKKGFQSKFTGTHGNMHYRWLGRLTLDGGEIVDCSLMAEYSEQPASKHGSGRFSNPLLKEWPHWNSGWPNLNTTGIGNNSVSVDDEGNIYLCGLGRRSITTNNAFMQMPSPVAAKGSVGYWSDFVRVYTPNYNTLRYSSLLGGPWDWYTGHGYSSNTLTDCLPTKDGLIVIGKSNVDKKTGAVKGNEMPIRNIAGWGTETRTGQMGVIGVLHFEK